MRTCIGYTIEHPSRWGAVLCGLLATLLAMAAGAQTAPLFQLEYTVTGRKLQVTPAALSVPKGIPGSFLASVLAGGNEVESEGTFIEATLRGPSFPARRIVGAPGQPILLPPLNLVGDYSLDNIRLVDSETNETVLEGLPSSIPIRVFDEVLIARVTSRPLSTEEIQNRGIVIDENNFRAVEFEVGFVVDGKTIPVKFPVVAPAFYGNTEIIPDAELNERLAQAELINESLTVGLPPELEATGLQIEVKGLNVQFVDPAGEKDLGLSVPPIAGLVVIPGKIGFLNQFFSVQVFVENAAPTDSGLSVTDVTAELVLPPGDDRVPGESYVNPGDDPLRFARVGSEAVIKNVLPVTKAGSDGVFGTSDDVPRLRAGEIGQSEFLVEGLREGLHVMDVKLKGTLEGLVAGGVEVDGKAAGSILVRNPNFSLAFSHPRTIRTGEPYTASVTILNTSSSPANLVTVTLPESSVSGARLESSATVELGDILPGQTATAEYELIAQQTGAITFSNFTSDDDVTGRFRLRMGVDERGVPLSPDSIGYPEFVDDLPDDLFRAADRVLGQALSIATAGQLPPTVEDIANDGAFVRSKTSDKVLFRLPPRIVQQRIVELAEAGQRLRYGDSLERVLADLLLDWQGARSSHPGFDQILKVTGAGRQWRQTIGNLLALEQSALSAPDRLADRGPDLAGRGESWWASSSGDPAIEPGFVGPDGQILSLDFSDLDHAGGYESADGGMVFLPPQSEGHFEWRAGASGVTTVLSVLSLDGDGTGSLITWNGVVLPAGGKAIHDPLGATPDLGIDNDGDGTIDSSLMGTVTPVEEPAPALIGAVQDVEVYAGRPRFERCTPTPSDINGKPHNNYGTIVGVLFSKPMDAGSVQMPESYVLDDGNAAVSVAIQPGGRVAILNLQSGIGLTQMRDPGTGDTMTRHRDLTVAGVDDPRGGTLTGGTIPVQLTANQGTAIEGRVVRADGSPAANVPVTLTYYEEAGIFCAPVKVRPTQVRTDSDGRFSLDFVMAGVPYSLSSTDTGGLSEEAIAIILQGAADDQIVREKLLELASQPGVEGTLLEQFAVGGLPEAIARAQGLDRALLKDVVEIGSSRIGSETPVALRFRGRSTVRGRVLAADGVTPVPDAAVNLFPDPGSREKGRGERTGPDGRFEFFGVPLGVFSLQVQAPDGTGRALSETLTQSGEERFVEVVLSSATIETTSVSGRVFEADGLTRHGGATVLIGAFVNNTVDGSLENIVALATTDVNGFFSADGVTVGSHDLVAISVDGTRRAVRLDAAFTAGNTTVVNLSLQARAVVRGRVEFSDGRPAENAIVAGGASLVRTDASGNFVLDGVPTGRRAISAGLERNEAAGIKFPRLGSTRLDVVPGGNNFAVIRFEPKGSITGRVLDQAGAPVPGMNVALPLDVGAFAYTRADENGVYLFENIGLREWTVSAPAPVASNSQEIIDEALGTIGGAAAGEETSQADLLGAITDAFAVFTGVNDPLLNGEGLTFNPISWGYEKVPLTFDGQVANADIIFLPAGTVSGTVINSQGTPIGARVRLTGIGPTRTGDLGFIIRGERNSDPATGVFEFPGQVLVGPFGLQAANPFFPVVVSHNDATRRESPDATGIFLQFPPIEETNGRLTGTVYNPDGTPVGEGIDVKISFGENYIIETRADGTFDTQIDLPAGGYSVEADDAGLRGRAYVNVRAGITNDVSVTLLGKGDLEILVTEADGTPVPNANVSARKVGFPSETFPLVTEADGTVFLANVFEGHYSVQASAIFGPTTIRGSAGVCVFRGETEQITVVLQPTGTIRGTFLEDNGVTPVAFAQIILDGGIGFATTDANGEFEIIGLPLRTYRLIATEPVSGRIGVANATLGTNGQVLTVSVVVRALGDVRGGVLNSARDGFVPGALVTMSPNDGLTPVRQATTGPNGQFSFPGTVEGLFTLRAVDPPSGIRGSVSGRLDPGVASLEIDIPLQPLGEITITVVEPDGTTPANATVTLGLGSGARSADTNAEGEALFGDLPLRSYELLVRSLDPGKERSALKSTISISQAGANAPLSVALLGVGSITGTVFESDGLTPADNATVSLRSNSSALGSETRNFVTGGNGTFSFNGVSVGSYQVTATSVALAASASGSIDAGGENDVIALNLGDNGTVRGRLFRADGSTPVVGLEVGVFFDSQSGLLGVKTDITAADGRFEMIGVPAGSFDLEALFPEENGIARMTSAVTRNGEVVDLGDVLLDEDDPMVESVSPSNNALDVSVIDDVLVTFNEAIDPSSFDANGIYLGDEFGTVPATLTVEDDGAGVMRVVRLHPNDELESETIYTLVVLDGDRLNAGGGGATARGPRDLVGRPLLVPFQSSFTTEDARPPELLSLTPAHGSVQNDVRSVVRLAFDEAMDPAGVFIMLNGPGGLVTGNSAFGVNNQVAVFTPDVPLDPNATYSVMASGFRDAAGNAALDQPFTASFATLDTIGPGIGTLRLKNGVLPVANAAVEIEAVLAVPEPGARLRLTADFAPIGETTTGDDLDLPYTLPESGRITVRGIAIDRFGNEGPVSELVIDVLGNQPPQISVTQILPGSGPIPSGSAFQLRAEATDDAGVASFRVATTGGAEIPLQSNEDGTAITLSGFVLANAGPGSPVTVIAQATDTSGESTPELSFEFPVADGTPPGVAFVSPEAGAEFSPGAVLPVELTLSDNVGVTEFDVAVTGAFTFNRTITVSGEPEQAVSTSVAVPADLTPDGSAFAVAITARDAAGNSGSASRSFAVPDLTPPSLEFVSPSNGSTGSVVIDVGNTTTPRGRYITTLFSEALDENSFVPGSIVMRDSNGTVVPGTVTRLGFAGDPRNVSFIPNDPLRFEETYTVEFTSLLADLAGNGAVPATTSFATSDFRLTQPADAEMVVEGQTIPLKAEGSNNTGIQTLRITGPAGTLADIARPGSLSSHVAAFEGDFTVPLLSDYPAGPPFVIDAQAIYIKNGGGTFPPVTMNPVTLDIRLRSEDSDNDGIDNGVEVDNGLDPFVDDASEDPDGDNLDNATEIGLGTDPLDDDTDGDGIRDDLDSDPLTPLSGFSPVAGVARPAGALDFDGIDDRVRIPTHAPIATGAGTIEASFIPDTVTGIHHLIYAGAAGDGFGGNNEMHLTVLEGQLLFLNYFNGGAAWEIRAGQLVAGQTYHVAASWNSGTGTIELYLDGLLIGSGDYTSFSKSWTNQILIGRHENAAFPERAFDGVIDEVRIWNVARSQGEIRRDARRRLTGIEPGLSGYWTMDEGAGGWTYDRTDKSHDAELGSDSVETMPTWVEGDEFFEAPVFAFSNDPLELPAFDPDGDELTATIVSLPSSGTLFQPDGVTALTEADLPHAIPGGSVNISYEPEPGFAGRDSFRYFVSDASDDSAIVAAAIHVGSANQPPSTSDKSFAVFQDVTTVLPVLDNASDPDGDAIRVVALSEAAHGTVGLNADGTISYTPAEGFSGTDQFRYSVADQEVWNRFNDFDEGVRSGSSEGNPDDGPFGFPTWRMDYVRLDRISTSDPWYRHPGDRMVWDPSWFGGSGRLWAVGNDLTPPLFSSGSHDSGRGVAMVHWVCPFNAYEVDVVGRLRTRWIEQTIGQDAMIAIAKRDTSSGVVEELFATTVSKPTANDSDESVYTPIDLRDVSLDLGDELIITQRPTPDPDGRLYFYDNELIILPASAANSATVALDVRANERPEALGVPDLPMPYAYFPFDEDADDAIGDLTGELLNGAALSAEFAPATGSGGSVALDGTNDFVRILDPTVLTAYTVSAWVKADVIREQTVVMGTGPFGGWSHEMTMANNGGFYHYTYDGNARTVSGATTVQPDEWHHVTITAANGGTMRLYLDGVEEASGFTLGTIDQSRDRWHVGAHQGGNSRLFDGMIDELAFWDRVLDPDQIAQLPNATIPDLSFGTQIETAEDTDLTIELGGTDGDGDSLTAVITGLPSRGTLYQTTDGVTRDAMILANGGTALEFDGVDDVVFLPGEVLNGRSDLTLQWWMTVDDSDGCLFSAARSGQANSFVICPQAGGDEIDLWEDGTKIATWDIASVVGELHSFSLVRNQTAGDVELFIDGISQGVKAVTLSTLNVASNGFVLAQDQDSVGGGFAVSDAFGGMLDEVRVWDRPLTAVEINARRLEVLAGNEAGLVALYRFDEGAGAVVEDATPNGFDGTFGDGSPGSDPDWVFSEALVGGGIRIPVTDAQRRVIYVPDADFNGVDSFEYLINDGKVDSLPGSISVDVLPVNDAPLAMDDDGGATVDSVSFTTRNVFTNDMDPEGDSFAIASFDGTSFAGGTVTDNGNGTFNYAPLPGFVGTDSFTYTLTDGDVEGSPATVNIDVIALNTFVWNNAAGGNWGEAANWTPNGVPGAGDKAIIELSGEYTVTLNVDATISVIEMGGGTGTQTFLLSARTLNVVNQASFGPSTIYRQTGGILRGPGRVFFDGEATWTGGSIQDAGPKVNRGTMTITPDNDVYVTDNGAFHNEGTVIYDGSGIFYAYRGGTLRNEAGALWDVRTDADMVHYSGTRARFTNAGTIRKSVGTARTTMDWIVNNAGGRVEVQTGELSFNEGGTNTDATYAVDAGGTVVFDGATHTMDGDCGFTGAGGFHADSGTVNFAGSFDLTGPVRVSGATWSVGGDIVVAGNYTQTSGALRGGGRVALAGMDNRWMGGSIQDAGPKVNRGTMRITPGDDVYVTDSGAFHNEGTVIYDGSGRFYAYRGGTLRNEAGALWDVRTDADMVHYSGTRALFTNAGTIRKSVGTARTTMDWIVDHAGGRVEVQTGELSFDEGGTSTGATYAVDAGGTVVFNGATHTMDGGCGFTGAGGFHADSGTVNFAGSFDLTGPVRVSGATWSVSGDIVVAGNYTQTSGALRGGGRVALAGTDNRWTGGSIQDAGPKVNRGTMRITPGDDVYVTDSGAFHNEGTVIYDGSGRFYAYRGGTLRNEAGALWDVRTNADMVHYTGTRARFTNAGTIRKSVGTARTTMDWIVNNAGGRVEVQTGELSFNEGGTNTDATYAVDAGGTVVFDGATHTMDGDCGFTGAGGFHADSGTVNFAGSFDLTGPVRVSGATWSVGSDIVVMGNYTQTSGALRGGGQVALAGTDNTWTGGSIQDAGPKVNRGTMTITPDGSVNVIDNGTFHNEGTVIYSGSGIFYAYRGARLKNAAGALWDVRTNADMRHYTGTRALFANEGEFRKSAGASSHLDWTFTNAGILSIQAGELEFKQGFTQNDPAAAVFLTGGSLRKSGTLTLSDGLLNGFGTINGTLTNNGATIRPGSNLGNLHITGNFTQGAGGTLVMEISGDVASEEFDTLSVGGTASLGGTMRVVTGAFTATPGEVYDLISYPAGAGGTSFTQLEGLRGQNGIDFTASYLADRFSLTAAPSGPAPGQAPPQDLIPAEKSGFEAWLDETFGPEHGHDSAICGDLADPDQDAICNLLEYAFGGHPLESTSGLVMPGLGLEMMNGERYFCLTYYRRTKATDLRYVAEASPDAQRWKSGPDVVTETTVVPVTEAFERVTVRQVIPIKPGVSTGYLRVRVERITE